MMMIFFLLLLLFTFNDAAIVDRLIFGGLGAQYGEAAVAASMKLVHLLKREIAGRVAVYHENGRRIAAADQIAEVINATARAQTLVLLQVADRKLELVLRIHYEST